MLKEIFSTVAYEIDSHTASQLRPGHAHQLSIARGTIWITRTGDPADYWLRPGATLPLAPGQTLWLSVEPGTSARIVLHRTPRSRPGWLERLHRSWRRRWRPVLARLG